MFWYNLKLTVRGLLSSKLFSIVNLVGFTIGFTCFVFLLLWIKNERSFDKYQENYHSIYRLTRKDGNKIDVPTILKPAFDSKYPEIKSITRIRKENNVGLNAKNESYIISDFLLADHEFISMYTHSFIHGNRESCLLTPNSLVLTESLAKKIFGTKNPIGNIISYEGFYNYTVTAVINDIPVTSSLHYEAIASFLSLKDIYDPGNPKYNVLEENYDWSFNMLFLVDENRDIASLNKKITSQILSMYSGFSPLEDEEFYLDPLCNFYFSTVKNTSFSQQGNLKYVKILFFISIFIIILTIINYINLSLAKDIDKQKKNSIFLLNGANKYHIMQSSIFETIILVLFSFTISIGLVKTFCSAQYSLFNLQLSSGDTMFIISVLLILLLSTIISRIALSLFSQSKYLSISLKRSISNNNSLIFQGKKALIISQYVISIVLIIATISIFKQIYFIKNSDLGFDKESVVFLNVRQGAIKNIDVIKEKLLQSPLINSVSFSDGLPGRVKNGNFFVQGDKNYYFNDLYSDPDYISTLGLEVVKGRNFSWERKSDFNEDARIVNETAVKEFGWENPLEETIWGAPVVGVVKDFHFRSMHQAITPLVLRCSKQCETINIRIDSENVASTVDWIKDCWSSTVPDTQFELFFLDDTIKDLYENETKLGWIISLAAIISLIISCLGIFGLSYFSINKRLKEIGIRKVNGARMQEILVMINLDYIKLIVISFVVSVPVAWYAIQKWLENFAYKTQISWWIFAVGGLSVFGIALVTVLSQSIKAANTNPVKVLKNE